MATDYKALGKRISNARKQAGITQEALGEQLNMTRKHISVIESAIKRPSLDALVDIANALDVSTDDLLVDSLMHSTSTSNSEIHRLLLYRLCLVMSNLSLRNGRTPRSCRIHLLPSMTESSSRLISSLPVFW